jgi:hypothetical protein
MDVYRIRIAFQNRPFELVHKRTWWQSNRRKDFNGFSEVNYAPSIKPHHPLSGQMRGYLTIIEMKPRPRGGDIEFCNGCSIEGCGLPGMRSVATWPG